MTANIKRLVLFIVSVCILIFGISYIKYTKDIKNKKDTSSYLYYETLPEDKSKGDPLEFLDENYQMLPGFVSNLPLVVLEIDGDLPIYKKFTETGEIVFEDVNPWVNGKITLFDNADMENSVDDEPILVENMKIKKRGHTSLSFDKPQYYISLTDENGNDMKANIFGMGEDDAWILNGSMADKSMIRNYIAYRTASQIMEYAPRCRFCEVLIKKNDTYEYQGVYLMMEKIKQSDVRVNIDKCNTKNSYTSYLVRRDRFTNFDTMLETYGRLNEFDPGWIGVKYPSLSKQTEKNIKYIEQDFSKIEQVLYSEDEKVFKQYEKYIDISSFVDYFLINEFFGNYDAGEHSTYMYKNQGEALKIGPVWDFDQAMNNSVMDETDPLTLAMQEKTFFKQLCQDKKFVNLLKSRYASLRRRYLNDEYIFSMIDETTKYLNSAREREWYRWAADYYDSTYENPGNYYLSDYEFNGETVSRFNDDYDQEIYNIKVYLSKHGKNMQILLTQLNDQTTIVTGLKGNTTFFLFVIIALFLIPSILINRK
ncbi:MAG: CotH kinase family protein [Lachnospiraceae bacterium]|nr:CotH kinase family protein [Lachnospiraceae bacterium]